MKLVLLTVLIAMAGIGLSSMQSDQGVCTLYRNSIAPPDGFKARLHIATFDSDDGPEYNWENCQLASNLFQQQPGTKTKFWCEKGRYRR